MDEENSHPLLVLFDSNTWEHVVHPHRRLRDPLTPAVNRIREAIASGKILPVLSETSVLIDQIPKGERSKYFKRTTASAIRIKTTAMGNGVFKMDVFVGGVDEDRELHPKFNLRVDDAIQLGFRVVPMARLGAMYPAEPNLGPYMLELPEGQSLNEVNTMVEEIGQAIEARGLGLSKLEKIARRIQDRRSMTSPAWFDGLDSPQSIQEEAEIVRAFAEWADGDSVAAAIAYRVKIYCTNDSGVSAGRSILDPIHKEWINSNYGLRFLSLADLDNELRGP